MTDDTEHIAKLWAAGELAHRRTCPTCHGRRTITKDDGTTHSRRPCPTCQQP